MPFNQQLSLKQFVCLLPSAELKGYRRNTNHQHSSYGMITDPLWREISVRVDGDVIVLRCANVAEEASRGGYCSAWYCPKEYTFTWADLDDYENVRNRLRFEQVNVYSMIECMLEHLREHRVTLRHAFA